MQKFLVPQEDVLVRDPYSFTPLPVTGAWCDWNGNAGRFWRRRVKCGDCTIGIPEPVVEEKEKEEIVEAIPETTSPNKRKRK